MKKYVNYFQSLAFLFLIFAAILFIAILQVFKTKNISRFVVHTHEVLFYSSNLQRLIAEEKTATRGFALTGKDAFLDSVPQFKKSIYANIEQLKNMENGHPQQIQCVDSLLFFANRSFAMEDSVISIIRYSGLQAGFIALSKCTVDEDMIKISNFSNKIQKEERLILDKKKEEEGREELTSMIIMYILLILFITLLYFYRRKEKMTRYYRQRNKEQLDRLLFQVNQSSDAIYLLDLNMYIQSWNQGAERMYGYTKEEAIGKNPNELLKTHISPEESKHIVQSIRERGFWTGEFRSRTKEGSDIYVLASISQSRDKENRILDYVSVNVDITEQKKLNGRVNYLADLVDKSTEAIVATDMQKKIIIWNKGAEELLGYQKQEVLGKTPEELRIIREESPKSETIKEDFQQYGKSTLETILFRKDGSFYYTSLNISLMKSSFGETHSMVFFINDISQRKEWEDRLRDQNQRLEDLVRERTAELYENEQHFRTLINDSFDIVTLFGEDLQIIYQSPSGESICGWTKEELVNTDIRDHIHPEDLDKANQILSDLLANPGKKINCLHRYRHKKGHYLWLEGNSVNLVGKKYVNAVVSNFHDVSERIQAQQQLASREKLFRTVLENNHDLLSILDESYRIKYRSPSAERITGWKDEDIMGCDIRDFSHPDDILHANEKFDFIRSNPGKSVSVGYRIRHKDGHFLWMEGEVINLLQDENINGILCSIRDVTQNIKDKEELIKSENRFRSLIEHSQEAISMTEASNKVIYRSPLAVEYIGDPVLGNLRFCATPEYYQQIVDSREESLKNPGVPIYFLGKFKKPATGTYHWLEGTLTNMLHIQGVECVVSNFRDITQKKEAEEKLRQSEAFYKEVLGRISEGFMAFNKDIRINYINEMAAQILGRPIGSLDGKKMTDEFPEVQAGIFFEAYHQSIQKGQPVHVEAFSQTLQKWIEGNIYGSDSGVSIFFKDITERKQMEIKLLEQQQEEELRLTFATLEAQERERNSIGQELHDNVNQVLASIKIFLSMVKKNPVKNQVLIDSCIENLEIAIRENKRMSHELSSPDFNEILLGDMLHSLTNNMLKHSGIKTSIDKEQFDEVKLNSEQKLNLYRIIQEQCNNIVKYAHAKQVYISLRTIGDSFYLTLKDDGVGMSPDKKHYGLGLKNIKNRIRLLAGELKIISSPGNGFELDLNFPLQKAGIRGIKEAL